MQVPSRPWLLLFRWRQKTRIPVYRGFSADIVVAKESLRHIKLPKLGGENEICVVGTGEKFVPTAEPASAGI